MAIPIYLKHPFDIHHIIPYKQCKEHVFDNRLITDNDIEIWNL